MNFIPTIISFSPRVSFFTSSNLYYYFLLFCIHILNPFFHFFKHIKILLLDAATDRSNILLDIVSTGLQSSLFLHVFSRYFLWSDVTWYFICGNSVRARLKIYSSQKDISSPGPALSKFLAWTF